MSSPLSGPGSDPLNPPRPAISKGEILLDGISTAVYLGVHGTIFAGRVSSILTVAGVKACAEATKRVVALPDVFRYASLVTSGAELVSGKSRSLLGHLGYTTKAALEHMYEKPYDEWTAGVDPVEGDLVPISDLAPAEAARQGFEIKVHGEGVNQVYYWWRPNRPDELRSKLKKVRRHRPRAVASRLARAMQEFQVPSKEWCVSLGIDLLQGRTLLRRIGGSLLRTASSGEVLPRPALLTTPPTGEQPRRIQRFAISSNCGDLEVIPELYAKLSLFAAFRNRDRNLQLVLKGHAITWIKQVGLSYEEVHPAILTTVMLSWLIGRHEKLAYSVLTNPTILESLEIPGLVETSSVDLHSLGFKSWWNPLYQLSKGAGLVRGAHIPKA